MPCGVRMLADLGALQVAGYESSDARLEAHLVCATES